MTSQVVNYEVQNTKLRNNWTIYLKLGRLVAPKKVHNGVYFDIAMATQSVPDRFYYAGMVIPFLELNKTLSASSSLIRGPSVMWALYMFQKGPSNWPCQKRLY